MSKWTPIELQMGVKIGFEYNLIRNCNKYKYMLNWNNSFCVEEVQLKIYWSVFDCAKVELLHFRYTLNILHLKTYIQSSYSPRQ